MYIDGDTHYWPVRFLERVKHPGRGHIEFQKGAGTMIRYGEKFPGDAATYYRDGKKIHSFSETRWNLDMHHEVMIYFVKDLAASVTRMVRFLKPGGVLFVVVTDETVGYTGLALKSFIEHGGDTGDNARHLSVIAERRRSLGLPAEGGGAIAELLGAAGTPVEMNVRRQPSRLYGHNLADLIALSSIALLGSVEGLAKFEAAAALLRHNPEAVDLRIEEDGPRKGMWSVTQPQWVAAFRRAR